MFALTVDQIDSRGAGDGVGDVLARTAALRADGAVLGPDRTAGDEFQLLATGGTAALHLLLGLHREGRWRIGLGVGPVAEPLPPTVREATGPALVAARAAIDAARRSTSGVVVRADADADGAADATAVLDLLLDLRAHRSADGWAVADLLGAGSTQREAAARLGITPQAVSLRVRSAGVRLEDAARPALVRMLDALDAAVATAA